MYYNKHNWINTTEIAAVSLESFFTNKLFKQDLSRAVYSTSEYAYRRRFELLDSSRNFENIEASSLQFPFMSYRIEDSWNPIPQKRVYSLESFGELAASLLGNLRVVQVENKIKILFHYDREDDARLAMDKLFFLSRTKWTLTTEVTSYRFDKLNVPIRISIDANSLTLNPKIKETDWLKQNRLFIISVDVLLESLILYPPEQLADGSTYEPEMFTLSEEVIMEFIAAKDAAITSVSDILQDNSITLNAFQVERVTKTTVRLSWDIQEQLTLDSLVLSINGKNYDLDVSLYTKTIRGLLPGAEYQAILYVSRGTYSKQFTLSTTTLADVSKASDIVGTTW